MAELEAAWKAMFGSEAGDPVTDLGRLEGWFGPQAQPKKIRTELRKLDPGSIRSETLNGYDPPLLLDYEGRVVLTPEGRWVLEALRVAPPSVDVQVDLLAPELVERYREWARAPFENVVATWRGEGSSTRPPALGLAAVVLVATHAQPERPLRLGGIAPAAHGELERLVRRFTSAIGQESGFKEGLPRFPLSIATQRFFGLCRQDGLAWFDPDQLEATLQAFAEELSGRAIDPPQAMAAFEGLVDGYEAAAAVFDKAGLPRLDRERTAELLARLRLACEAVAQA